MQCVFFLVWQRKKHQNGKVCIGNCACDKERTVQYCVVNTVIVRI